MAMALCRYMTYLPNVGRQKRWGWLQDGQVYTLEDQAVARVFTNPETGLEETLGVGRSPSVEGIPYADLVSWPFADYVFGADWDVMSDVTKSRLYGFHDVVDSEAMFVRLLGRFREERIVP